MGDFKTDFKQLEIRIKEGIDSAKTEEAIKNLSVMPFLKNLGYDVFNINEVCPEYNFNGGIVTNEKVDYCIFNKDVPVFIVECKAKDKNLDFHKRQLFDYFNKIDVRIAILTNGKEYQFFSDIEKPNIMDTEPFWVMDLTNLKEDDFDFLIHLRKDNYNKRKLTDLAFLLKYKKIISELLKEEISNPSDDFTKLIMSKIGIKSKRKDNVEQFRTIILDVFNDLTDKHIQKGESFEEKNDNTNIGLPFKEQEVVYDVVNGGKFFILNGQKIYYQYSYEILYKVSEWLIKKGCITRDKCPISFTKNRNLIHYEPVHKNHKQFFSPKILSNGLYIEVHASTNTIINLSEKLLDYCGFPKTILEIHK